MTLLKDDASCHPDEREDRVMSDSIETRIARIESDVQHIKADTADLRVELRRTNDKIDGVRDGLTKRIDSVRDELTKKIDDFHKELTGKIDSLKDTLHSLTLWALLLYFTLAGGLLTVIARAFKWI